MRHKKLALLAVVVLGVTLSLSPAFAKHGHGKSWGIKDKFFHKAHGLLKHQDELELTEQQIQSIKDLKHATKKNIIRKEAEIDVLAIDIRAELYDYPVDVKAIQPLLDQKYAVKKSLTEETIAAYAKLKSVLNEQQWKDFKLMMRSR